MPVVPENLIRPVFESKQSPKTSPRLKTMGQLNVLFWPKALRLGLRTRTSADRFHRANTVRLVNSFFDSLLLGSRPPADSGDGGHQGLARPQDSWILLVVRGPSPRQARGLGCRVFLGADVARCNN